MDNENNTKKALPPELPEKLLAQVSGGIGDSDKKYKVLDNYYVICEKYQYRYKYPHVQSHNCLLCQYFRYDAQKNKLYCTYPDDYGDRWWYQENMT